MAVDCGPQRPARQPERRRHAQHRQPVAPAERLPIEHAGDEVQRRRQVRALEPGAAARAVDHGDGEARLHADVIARADRVQKRERLDVGAGQDVLAVVDHFAGLAVVKGGRPPAQPAARFEHEDARALLHDPDGRAQAGESGADDDDVGAAHDGHSHWRRAISACRGRGTRARPENTS